MPCQSPAELEHGQWRTLPDAVAHICAADCCDKDDAHRQLRKALADGALGMLRWENAQPPPRIGGSTVPLDNPPACIPDSAEIDWEAGTVRDEWGKVAPAPRVLLILGLALRRYWPDMHPRANRDDEDRYEAQQTRWMRGAREKREAEEAAREAVWNAEFAKPMPQRQYFSFGEVADELAFDPTNYAVDAALRARIIEELTVWVRRQQFDLAGGEVARLTGAPPAFEPLQPIPADAILVGVESWLLRRDACRRFLKQSLHPRAPSVLSEWRDVKAAAPVTGKRKPGPEPILRANLCRKMLDDLRSERRTPEALKAIKITALPAEYGGSPNTAAEARNDALAQFSELQNLNSAKL
jgi:hypothetical protein